ncbi:oligopeptide ABC transporter substrate-binding protein [Desmospora profundinema]|uniref:Peptide/nickel transport system substrate-binding protein n=1 Tax=Desmospora profundinema TaxID=1571184 RepID=A0ABU1IMF3_9BACL|nr:oligopeptide ABC transporter substrate-binding protein [Desmospora profundinema]MDR6225588.1 peptide/nickel transport system substrate-binding protein [Desmospora profundinema]
MKRSLTVLLSMMLLMSLFLAACSGSSAIKEKGKDTITYAVDQAPEGLFIPGFAGSAIDSQVNDFIHDDLIKVNEKMEYQPHIAKWESDDNITYTFTIEKGIKWHNGEELTMEDWQFALEVIADPDYDGPRYNYVENIKGADEYRKGKADSISGFEIVDPYTAKVTFKEKKVNNLENLWTRPMPKKALEGLAVAELSSSKEVQETPVGLGPFKVKKITPGEYVLLERFDDYWQGKPKLAEVTIKVIDPSLSVGSLENGEVDIMEIRPDDVEQLESVPHIDVKEQEGLGYSYIGFRFGHWDKDKRKAVDDYEKYQDKRLRQAMFYALDREALINAYLAGKATPVDSPIPSVHWIRADDSELTPYHYDKKKAEQLLDQAGYKDMDGDGFREDPGGNKFEIKFGHYAGPSAFEGRAQAIIQNWKDVGLNAKLATGQLVEFNTYNEMKDNDDKELEVFFGAWVVGSDPDPSGLWASTAEWNFGRWVNEESDQLLKEALSDKAFDRDYRKDKYVKWQQLFNDELPALPLWENMDLYGMNQRLHGVVIDATGLRDFHQWYVK